MSANISIDSLLEHCQLERAVLCTKVTNEHLEVISRTVLTGELWRRLAPHLKVDRNVVDNIEYDYRNEESKKYAFLCKWSEINKGEATYERLIEGLLKINASAAGKVCQLLLKHVKEVRSCY